MEQLQQTDTNPNESAHLGEDSKDEEIYERSIEEEKFVEL